MWVFEFIFFFSYSDQSIWILFFQIKNRNNVSVSMEFLLYFQTGDKFKFKTWKSLDPGKSHVGVSESLWIWQIQIQNLKNHRTREIACWCEWVFLNLTNSKSILEKSQLVNISTIHIMAKQLYHAFISWKFTYIYKLSSDRPSQLKIVILHIKRYIKDT